MKRLYTLSLYLINHRLVRYLFSGGTALLVDLVFLYIFVHAFHIWYVLSSTLAFMIAFFVSFYMQKFLTFTEHSRDRLPAQMRLYFLIALINLGINAIFMYIQVDILSLHYLLAQIFASGIIALYSFFVYKHFVFHNA